MKIFIDSNIFYNNWHLNGANFDYLFNFIENTNSELLLSKLVCEEVDNKFDIETEELFNIFKNGIRKGQNLLNVILPYELNQIKNDYSLKTKISQRTSNFKEFDYDDILNSTVVKRAIKKTRPFRDNEKGYRDTLIWLSLLKFLECKDFNEIVFISNNSNDFYNLDKSNFHRDLLEDLNRHKLTSDFRIFDSLKAFIDSEINLGEHKFTSTEVMDNYIYPNEGKIEDIFEAQVNSRDLPWFNFFLKNSKEEYKDINYVTEYSIKIDEGIEDPELINWELLTQNELFLEIIFILRIVDIHFIIPTQVYLKNKDFIEDEAYALNIDENYAKVWMMKKIIVNASLTNELTRDELIGFSINSMQVLK